MVDFCRAGHIYVCACHNCHLQPHQSELSLFRFQCHNTVTALIFTVLIFHESTTWTVFTILFSQIHIEERPFKVGNSYFSEYHDYIFMKH